MPDHYEEEEKKEEGGIYPKNGQVPDEKDLPPQEVKRHDGLVTMDDIKKMFGGGGCGHERMDKEKELGNFIELIIKIGK